MGRRGFVREWILTVAAAVTIAGCGSSHGVTEPSGPSTSTIPDQFTGCNPTPPTPVVQTGQSQLVLLFSHGTTAAQMDAVANNLVPASRAEVQAALASGVVSVNAATCSPPEIEVGYRSSLDAKALAALEKRLLAEPRVIKVEPAGPIPVLSSVLGPAAATVYFRPVLCTIPPATPAPPRTSTSPSTACTIGKPASIASTPAAEETPAGSVILPAFDNSVRYVLGPADLTAHDVATAVAVPLGEGGSGYQVELNLTARGNRAMEQVTAVRYRYYEPNSTNPSPRSMEAIEVGGVVESAPIAQSANFQRGSVVITYSGYSMTLEQANALVRTIDTAIKA